MQRIPLPVRACNECAGTATAISRRDFVTRSTVISVAALLCGCGDGADGGAAAPSAPGQPVPIATPIVVTLENFPVLAKVGGVARVSSQPPVALARTADGLVGFSLSCSHLSTTVNINDNFTLRCPNHGAEFAFDGTWTGGQQQTSSLFRVTVTLSTDGKQATISG